MKIFKNVTMAVFVALATVLFVAPAPTTDALNSSALSIAPRKDYTIEPGKSIKDTLQIRNLDSAKELNLTMRVIDFTYTDDGGTPKLMLDPKAPQTTWSLKPFLTAPSTVKVAPSSAKTVPISIEVPANQGAGSFYSAIMYSTGTADGGNVGLAASGVTLVFVDVPGKVRENLELKKFGAFDNSQSTDGQFEYFAIKQPQYMAYKLLNSGNVAENPTGNITITGLFGQKYIIEDINPGDNLALIDQTRTFTACIKWKQSDNPTSESIERSRECTNPGFWPGLYTATLDLLYGQNGNETKEIIKTVHFWYLPWWFIITAVVVIAVATYYIWKTVKKIRNRLYGPRLKKLNRRK